MKFKLHKIALAEGGTVLFETHLIDTMGGLLRLIWPDGVLLFTRWHQSDRGCPVSWSGQIKCSSIPSVSSASPILSGGTQSLSLKFKRIVKPSSTRFMSDVKGQVYADKWAPLVQLRWVLEAREHYPGNHGIYGSADHNLKQIRWLFGNLLSFARRQNNIYFELFDKCFDSFAVNFACNFTCIFGSVFYKLTSLTIYTSGLLVDFLNLQVKIAVVAERIFFQLQQIHQQITASFNVKFNLSLL